MNYRMKLPKPGTRVRALFDVLCRHPNGCVWSDLQNAYCDVTPRYYRDQRQRSGLEISRLIKKFCNHTGERGNRLYTLKPEWAKVALSNPFYCIANNVDDGKLRMLAAEVTNDGYPTTTLLHVPENLPGPHNDIGSPEIRDLPWRSVDVVEADKNVQRIIELEDELAELDLNYNALKFKIKEWRDAASHAVVLAQQLDIVTVRYFSDYLETLQAHLATFEQDIEDNI